MSGITSTTFSPSRVTTRRNTPWVVGCCGPMLSINSSVRKAIPLTLLDPGRGGPLDAPPQERFLFDLVLQLEEALDQGFRSGRAARHVHINGDHLVNAFENRVVIVVEGPAARRTRAHGDDVFGLGHLLPQTADDGRNLQGGAPSHDNAVGLPRGRTRDDTHAVHIKPRSVSLHHLDRTAGQAEGQRPHRGSPPPVQNLFHFGQDDAATREGIDNFESLVERERLTAGDVLWVSSHRHPPGHAARRGNDYGAYAIMSSALLGVPLPYSS